MKKFLKIFFALVVLVVVAVVGLITFIDPNEYRGYLVQQVQEKTGYQLEINGDLRWHVWPQISILVDDVAVTAPGAKDKMAKAQNMRLDVELMPLFSKQLSIKEVLVKGAVIRLTEETKAAVIESQPNVEPNKPESNDKNSDNSQQNLEQWSLGLDRFEIADSTFVLQQSENKDDLLTVRNINVLLSMKTKGDLDLVASSTVNRNQQDISASIKAKADLKQFPKQIAISVDELAYQLKGVGFPTKGINGNASVKLSYDLLQQQVVLTDLKANANGNSVEANVTASLGAEQNVMIKLTANAGGGTINGDISGSLGDIPDLIIKITGSSINVDKLSHDFAPAPQPKPVQTKAEKEQVTSAAPTASKQPTSSTTDAPSHELAFLNGLKVKLSLSLNSVVASGLTINDVVVEANNNQGNLQLSRLSARLLGGSVSAPGSINAKGKSPFIQLNPKIENIDMDIVSKTFDLPPTLSGQLNMAGKLSGSGLNANTIKNSWNAELNTRVDNARLNNINLKQIIQKAASLSNKDVKADERYEQYTQVRKLSTLVILQKGVLQLNGITVDSEALNVGGAGSIGLAKMQCDISLNVKLMQGWQGNKEVVELLKTTAIPVHIYGPCSNLSYKVDVEKILKDQLKTQANKVVDKYLGKSSTERTDAVANKVFGQITGKKF